MSVWSQWGLLDLCTNVSQSLGAYHDLVLVIIGSILIGVGLFLSMFLLHKRLYKGMLNRSVKSNEKLEVVWTLSPAVFLSILGFESLVNLYSMEVGDVVVNSVEAHGHQWYWDYNYVYSMGPLTEWCSAYGWNEVSKPVFSELSHSEDLDSSCLSCCDLWVGSQLVGDWAVSMESYGIEESSLGFNSLKSNNFRKMDVTSFCILWQGMINEVKVSTSDVMHSWGVPSLGVKADAIPGRVNVVGVNPLTSGFYFGNCYELCGPGHSSMPILVGVFNRSNSEFLLQESVVNCLDWDDFTLSYEDVKSDEVVPDMDVLVDKEEGVDDEEIC
uniref:Cytochrome c oxidase subunit 2 n=1 Tax=Mactra antiquata TaxID=2302425 RepID=R4I2Q6_9BIVA|nr:cytochrome c oxidase subunit II [Mactra antiquata]AFC39854.1 cytochrome c oxidase subunit II [Mactra antiquata]AGH15622.1 cytochrome c oxidase subunit 2 [Mactra antiquata]